MGAFDAHIVRCGQIRPAPTAAFRAVRYPLIRDAHPWHRGARGTRLLSRLRPEFFARFGAGFALPGRSSLQGGIDELPLLRHTSRRTRSSSAV